jgi:hypothetical protein
MSQRILINFILIDKNIKTFLQFYLYKTHLKKKKTLKNKNKKAKKKKRHGKKLQLIHHCESSFSVHNIPNVTPPFQSSQPP